VVSLYVAQSKCHSRLKRQLLLITGLCLSDSLLLYLVVLASHPLSCLPSSSGNLVHRTSVPHPGKSKLTCPKSSLSSKLEFLTLELHCHPLSTGAEAGWDLESLTLGPHSLSPSTPAQTTYLLTFSAPTPLLPHHVSTEPRIWDHIGAPHRPLSSTGSTWPGTTIQTCHHCGTSSASCSKHFGKVW
jgi:hypothetical protein